MTGTDFFEAPRRYTRRRDGAVYHRRECRFAKAGVPWLWADRFIRDHTENDLWNEALRAGVKPCGACKP